MNQEKIEKSEKIKKRIEYDIEHETDYINELKKEKKGFIDVLQEVGLWTTVGVVAQFMFLFVMEDNRGLFNLMSQLVSLFKYSWPILTIPALMAGSQIVSIHKISQEEKKSISKIKALKNNKAKIENAVQSLKIEKINSNTNNITRTPIVQAPINNKEINKTDVKKR